MTALGRTAYDGFLSGRIIFTISQPMVRPGEDRCMNSGPPLTWREHWFEHDQLLYLAGATSHVAVYFDADVNDEPAVLAFLEMRENLPDGFEPEGFGCQFAIVYGHRHSRSFHLALNPT